MTNREIINFAKENGFIDVTEDKYDYFETVNGHKMRQIRQKDILTFEKKITEEKSLTIDVSNDIWSFDGLTSKDRISNNEFVDFNQYRTNPSCHIESAIISLKMENDSLIITYKCRTKSNDIKIMVETIDASEEN